VVHASQASSGKPVRGSITPLFGAAGWEAVGRMTEWQKPPVAKLAEAAEVWKDG